MRPLVRRALSLARPPTMTVTVSSLPRPPPLQALLDANAAWADAVHVAEPDFFATSAQGQHPKVLWIGCADSRVPESVLTGARPGDIFVHRNIANQVHPEDESVQAVLAYAISVVGVEHVVIAGHTHCGGAAACLQAVVDKQAPKEDTPLARWLAPLTRLVDALDRDPNAPGVLDVVVRENVKRQVEHVCVAAPVRQAWTAGKPLSVHGWVYDIASGRIKDLGISRGPGGPKETQRE